MSFKLTIGRTAIAGKDIYTNEAIAAFFPGDPVTRDFLYYWLPFIASTADTDLAIKGATLNKKKLADITGLLPPLDEQRRIAEVLRSMDEVISIARELADKQDVVRQRIIDNLCFETSGEFSQVSLGDVLMDIRYGTSSKCDATAESGRPVLRIPNVVKGRIDYDDLKYADVPSADVARLSLRWGDIVLVRTNGNPAYIGRNAFINVVDSSLLFASYLIRLRCDERRAWPPYIHAVFNSERVRAKLLKAATTSAGNYNINSASLKALTLSLPQLPRQKQVAEIIAAATRAVDESEAYLQMQHRLRNALASDLLSGRVRVSV
jgi:type I restriction enzyme S subunit